MCERLETLVAKLRDVVAHLDASQLEAARATELVALFAETERLTAAGRTIAAGRVADTHSWRTSGHRTAAQWVASQTQGTLGHAISTLETARRLEELPATRSAFVSGRLSEIQAVEISAAAAVDRNAERKLIELAARESVAALKERCRDVRSAAAGDEDACERIRRGRYLRDWIDHDGAVRLDARLAPDDGARLLAAVKERAMRLQNEARRSGRHERAHAYAADALVALAEPDGPRAVVHVQVDQAALERGRTEPGETCRIPGVGPIAVTTARRLATDAVLKAIQTDGSDVRGVAHMGRTIPARLRTALEVRDESCVVPGCDVRTGLEIDHIKPYALGGSTKLENLARLCRFHHAQKTHHGWRLGGVPGNWTWSRARPKARASARAP